MWYNRGKLELFMAKKADAAVKAEESEEYFFE